jgi:tRNA-splicing ligase RtcB
MEILQGTEDRKSIFSWCPNIEEKALDQMKLIATMAYVRNCALMPDAHMGMQMPIGGVVSCDSVVVPNFVGADIGCGMGAFKASLKKEQVEEEAVRKRLLHSFARGIPVGFSHNTDKRKKELAKQYDSKIQFMYDKTKIYDIAADMKAEGFGNPVNLKKDVIAQLGTLGGGNHFCEVQYDEEGTVWIMLHSGSRNMGKKIGDFFNELATKRNAQWHSKGAEIPFLPTDTPEGKYYLAWMDFALRFAFLNRQVMLDEVKRCMEHEFPRIEFVTEEIADDTVNGMINIHHNFASLENHFGKNVWIHRKGATMAREGQTGIIPGSMGTASYIVKGKGNIHSMMSCSHGAGRKMGRREFCRQMEEKFDEIEESLEGIVHSDFGKFEHGKDKGKLDVSEAPGAYKDIEDVINNELDLIDPIVKLRPLVCLKG